MRKLILVPIIVQASCGEGPTILEVYELPSSEVADRVPRQVRVCWGLQAGHMKGFREAGLEQDIAQTCQRTADEGGLSADCRGYAEAAARYGTAAAQGSNLAELADRSDDAFASCAD